MNRQLKVRGGFATAITLGFLLIGGGIAYIADGTQIDRGALVVVGGVVTVALAMVVSATFDSPTPRHSEEPDAADKRAAYFLEIKAIEATAASNTLLVAAVALLSLTVGFGFAQAALAEATSTEIAIQRLAIVLGAIYLAGQFFRRSAYTSRIALEFDRASIAMSLTDELAEKLNDCEDADALRRSVYAHHLTAGDTDESGEDEVSTDKLVEAIVKKLSG